MSFISSSKWVLLGSSGQQGLGFLVFLLLSYILVPEDFGVYALALVVIETCNQLSRLGLSVELISSRDDIEVKYTNAFWCSFMTGILLSGVIYITAAFWASLLDTESLIFCLELLSVVPTLYALKCIPDAILQREFRHKNMAIAELISLLISSVVALSSVYFFELTVLALVLQKILFEVLLLVFLWLAISWRPSLQINFKLAKSQLKKGYPFIISNFITTASYKSKDVFIGIVFGPVALGYFRLALKIQDMLNKVVLAPVTVVLLPYLAKTDRQDFNDALHRIIFITALLVVPMYMGMALIAKDLIEIVFSSQWQPAGELIVMLCVFGVASLIFFMFKAILGALGSGNFLIRVVLVYIFTLLAFMILFAQSDVLWVIYSDALAVLLATVYGLFKVREVTGFSLRKIALNITPIICVALMMMVSVIGIEKYLLLPFEMHLLLNIVIKVLVGFVSYILLFRLFYKEKIKNLILPLLKGRSKILFKGLLRY